MSRSTNPAVVKVAKASPAIDPTIDRISTLVARDPEAAFEQLRPILRSDPPNCDALLLASKAHRFAGRPREAGAVVAKLLAIRANAAGFREAGEVHLALGEPASAERALERAVADDPGDPRGWIGLGDARRARGDDEGCEQALLQAIAASFNDAQLMIAALALAEGRLSDAEPIIRARLREHPTDIVAIRMMAELATKLGRFVDAEKLLRRALALAPFFSAARELLARNLQRLNRPVEALAEVKLLLAREANDPSIQLLEASLLVKIGDQEGARRAYEHVLATHPRQAKSWMSLGHVLKTLGRKQDGIAAYRKAIEESPKLGEAWWSIANLKTVAFSPADVSTMEHALAAADADEDRLHLHFALGKAREDERAFGAAFAHWTAGNALRRGALSYDAERTHDDCEQAARVFNAELLSRGTGYPARDPIFIVGLPRSGSTLVEQILASHSQIEGTMELPDMMAIAARLAADASKGGSAAYPELVANLPADALQALGQEYLERTHIHRQTDRPLFIDKMPNNWLHVGLIRMILPNARIIDARRNPADCCVSAWKQHFARGQAFSYDLTDLGRYYRDYVALMAHFDRAMPGVVHRVQYEQMVLDTEAEVGRLLEYLDLPFEDACLSFWKNDRPVRTASSEQVRKPIFSDALDHWRHFEPWLEPLFSALGPDLTPARLL